MWIFRSFTTCNIGGYRNFGGTSCLHPSYLKMETIGSSETTVNNSYITRRKNPKDQHLKYKYGNAVEPLGYIY
jgi:hypothetical protein